MRTEILEIGKVKAAWLIDGRWMIVKYRRAMVQFIVIAHCSLLIAHLSLQLVKRKRKRTR
jgi:hypothetical protein